MNLNLYQRTILIGVLSSLLGVLFHEFQIRWGWGWGAGWSVLGLIVVGLLVAYPWPLRGSSQLSESLFSDGFVDLMEEYHFGIQRSSYMRWAARGLAGLILCLGWSVAGPESFYLSAMAGLILFWHRGGHTFSGLVSRRTLDERQGLVVAAFSGVLTVLLGTPISAALLCLEFVGAATKNLRVLAILSAVTSFWTTEAFRSLFGMQPESLKTWMIHLQITQGPEAKLPLRAQSLHHILLLFALGVVTAFVLNGFYFFMERVRVAIVQSGGLHKNLEEPEKPYLRNIWITVIVVFTLLLYQIVGPGFGAPWSQLQQKFFSGLTSENGLPGSSIFATAPWVLASVSSVFLVGIFVSGESVISLSFLLAAALAWTWNHLFELGLGPVQTIAAVSTMVVLGRSPLLAVVFCYEFVGASGVDHLGFYGLLGLLSSGLLVKWGGFNAFWLDSLKRRGILLQQGRCTQVLARLRMRDAMVRDFETILESSDASALRRLMAQSPYGVLAVRDEVGRFKGLITLDQISPDWEVKGISPLDLMDRDVVKVGVDDVLSSAFDKIQAVSALAVLDPEDRLVGLVFLSHLQARYKREVVRQALQWGVGSR